LPQKGRKENKSNLTGKKRGKTGKSGKLWEMEEWNVGRMAEPSPSPAKAFCPAKLASWPQPYFIGVLCVSKVATKLAKLAGE